MNWEKMNETACFGFGCLAMIAILPLLVPLGLIWLTAYLVGLGISSVGRLFGLEGLDR